MDLALVDPRQVRRVRDRMRVGVADGEVTRGVPVEQRVEEGPAEPADAALPVDERNLAEPRGALVGGAALAQSLRVRVRFDLDRPSAFETDPQAGHERAADVERLGRGNDALGPFGIRGREELLGWEVRHMLDAVPRRRAAALLREA